MRNGRQSRRSSLRSVALVAVAASALFAAAPAPPAQQAATADAALSLFDLAQRLERDGDLEAALENYELLVQQFPAHHLADDALLGLARGRWDGGDVAGSEEAIGRLKQEYARQPAAAGAFVLEAEIEVARARGAGDLQDARDALSRVPILYGPSEYPELPWRAQALVISGEISLLLDEVDAAAATFLSAIEDEAESSYTGRARLGLATVFLRSGNWVPAAEILQRIVDGGEEAGTDPVTAAAARRRLSMVHRLIVRPAMGQQPWLGARRFRVPGTQYDDPIGVGASEDGWVTVIDEGVPVVAVVDPQGGAARKLTSEDSYHPFFGPDGTAYVAHKSSVMEPLSRQRTAFDVPDGDEIKTLEEIRSGARGIFGDWFLLDDDRNRVIVFDPAGNYSRVVVEGDRVEPVDLARDYLGRIYVLDRRAESVVRLGPDGNGSARVASGDWRRPEALAVDELGHIYVLDRDEKVILVFDGTGRRLWQIGPRLPGGIELRSPRDVAVDGTGRVYVADRDLKEILVLE